MKFSSHHIPADELSKLRFNNQTYVNKKSKVSVDNDKQNATYYNDALKEFMKNKSSNITVEQMLSKMIDNMVDDKVGLVVFAGEAFTQLPITCDYVSAKMFLNTITPNLIQTQVTAIGTALQTAITSFGSQESEAGRAIILITDGENHEDDAIAAAKKAQELGIQVFVIGIGKPEGAPIPKPGTNDYFKDRSGQVVVSRLNEEMCQQIAQAGSGAYVRCDNTNTAMRALQQELDRIATTDLETTVYADYNEQYQSFVLIALLLLAIEFFILSRKNHRLTRMDLFKEKSENR